MVAGLDGRWWMIDGCFNSVKSQFCSFFSVFDSLSAGLYFLKNQYSLVAAAAWFSPFASKFLCFCSVESVAGLVCVWCQCLVLQLVLPQWELADLCRRREVCSICSVLTARCRVQSVSTELLLTQRTDWVLWPADWEIVPCWPAQYRNYSALISKMESVLLITERTFKLLSEHLTLLI